MIEELKILIQNRINFTNHQINIATNNGDVTLLAILETQLEEAIQTLNQLNSLGG